MLVSSVVLRNGRESKRMRSGVSRGRHLVDEVLLPEAVEEKLSVLMARF